MNTRNSVLPKDDPRGMPMVTSPGTDLVVNNRNKNATTTFIRMDTMSVIGQKKVSDNGSDNK